MSPTSQERIGKQLKKERALKLRIDGWTFRAIADELGYRNESSPFRLVREALDDIAAKSTENAVQLRTLEMERLTGIIRDADEILRDPETKPADKLRALELKVRASESLRKLWGLDAPAALDLTSGGNGLPSIPELIEALRAAERIESDEAAHNE